MAYCTLADIGEQIDERELIALADDTGGGEVVLSVVDRAIADADADIDAAIGSRYPLPLSAVPALLRSIAVDLSIYWLFSRRSVTGMPEIRQRRRDIAAKKLEQLASGALILSVSDNTPATGGRAVVVPASRMFTDTTMGGY